MFFYFEGIMNEISEEMYRRLYRLLKRKIPPESIAGTLNIPLRTVHRIIDRINITLNDDPKANAEKNTKPEQKNYLDIYVFSKTRYSVIQLVGTLTEPYLKQLENELEKAFLSQWKAIAIEMSDILSIDKVCCELILTYNQKFTENEKFLAILDPSQAIEPHLLEFGLENVMPVFGTELAFEENAFKKNEKIVKTRVTP